MKNIAIAAACLCMAAGCRTHDDPKPQTGYVATNHELPRAATTTDDHVRPSSDDVVATTPAMSGANNTSENVRDRDGVLPTPFDQGSEAADIERTTTIRKRIMESDLSITAQNVKVITALGRVTLRGPVKSYAEKETIGRIARDVAGEFNVDDLLEVIAAR